MIRSACIKSVGVRVIWILALMLGVLTAHCWADSPEVSVIGDSKAAIDVVTEVAKEFCRTRGLKSDAIQATVDPMSGLALQSQAKVSVPWHITVIVQDGQAKQQKGDCLVGEWRVGVVAGPRTNLERMTLDELRDFLRSWEGQEDKAPKTKVFLYTESKPEILQDVIRGGCMRFRQDADWGYRVGWYLFRKDMTQLTDAKELVRNIKAGGNAIGLVLCGNPLDLQGLRMAKICKSDKDSFVQPAVEKVMQPDYPLTQRVLLRVNADAPPLAKEFADYCLTAPAAKIASQHGLITQWDVREAESEQRLADMKAGRGDRLSTIGVDSARSPFQDLATEYVRAKATLQVSYAAIDADVSSIGAFVNGKGASVRELLVLADKPSTRAMELHGEKWNLFWFSLNWARGQFG